MNYLKNPLVLGVIAGGATYGGMYYYNIKKSKEEPEKEIKPVNYLIPIIVAIVVVVITYSYFRNRNIPQLIEPNNISVSQNPTEMIVTKIPFPQIFLEAE